MIGAQDPQTGIDPKKERSNTIKICKPRSIYIINDIYY
jgi:hypothetical protein